MQADPSAAAAGLIAGAGFVSVAIVAARQIAKRRAQANVPPMWSTGVPLLGGFLAFAKDPLGTVERARQELGGTFTIQLLTEKVTFLIGPEPHGVFFGGTDEELDQADVYKFMTPIFGPGVVYDCSLDKRRQQMRALGAALKPANLRRYPEIIAGETVRYLESKWGEEGTVDIHQAFADLIIQTGSATLMGPEIRNELFDEMHKLYQDLDKGLTPLSVFFPYAPTAAHARRDRARKEIGKLFAGIIEKRLADPEASKNMDIVQRLMEFSYTDGTKLTYDEIAGMMVATLFAAQHTSNVTATWTTLFLLEDKRNGGQLLRRALDEIAKVEPAPGMFAAGQGLDHKVIAEETFLQSCIKEAIRMFPPIIFLMRRALVDIPLPYLPGNVVIPKGHMVMVSNAVSQRVPEVFERPNDYLPDRWASFDIGKLPKYSFIGFGAGIHTCMGESFAFMQSRTILSVLLSKYELDLTTPFPTPDYESIVVMPHGPNLVRYKRRAVPNMASGTTAESAKGKPTLVPAQVATGFVADTTDGVFTKAEVAKHNKRNDLWIIVKGNVYDITQYVDLHQGGVDALLRVAGGEATEQVQGPQHPGTVPTLLERYKIGKLEG